MGRPTKLTEEVLEILLGTIREGAFAWVAAEAAGISRSCYFNWIKRGKKGDKPFANAVARIRQAQAQARIGAERSVRMYQPLSWLRMGPGRDQPGAPGWTQPAKPGIEPVEDEQPVVGEMISLEELAEAMNAAGWEATEEDEESEGRAGDGRSAGAE